MQGHPFPFRGGHPQPPPPNPNNNHNFYFQSPPLPTPNNNNFYFQSPLLPNVPNPFFHPPPPPPPPPPSFPFPSTTQPPNPKLAIDHADRAVASACRSLLAAGESVSAWKVSQDVLLTLQVDSWNSLGIKMQQVPSLHHLMFIEAKVNAFIHCFVGVRKITSMYDLEVAICQNEGVHSFEVLGLGPFLRHPLVIHYFSLHSDVTQVFKITSEEIIQLLSECLDASKRNKSIKVEQFLDFIAKKRSVKCKEWLGIRIQNLGMHVYAIREARNSELSTLDKYLKTLNSKNEKFGERPISSSRKKQLDEHVNDITQQVESFSSSQKKQLDERFNNITQRVESFSSVKKSFCGKHIRFMSSSSEDEDSDSSTNERNNNIINGSQSTPSSKVIRSSERVSSCPYPSATEEIARLGVKTDMVGQKPTMYNNVFLSAFCKPPTKKRKLENESSTRSCPYKLRQRNKFGVVTPIKNKDLSIPNDSLQMFVTTWKDACSEHQVGENLEALPLLEVCLLWQQLRVI
ncbi:hypothetical protein VNO78_11296 [Psophocarpus tetragonolobus]|uniref:Uncharacterized protein n=1 Tax=Psophocarpus tetragonolobus TaxID=3891 RepID=A0AAN9SM28_PSOTE